MITLSKNKNKNSKIPEFMRWFRYIFLIPVTPKYSPDGEFLKEKDGEFSREKDGEFLRENDIERERVRERIGGVRGTFKLKYSYL